MPAPLLSVIVPTRNRATRLRGAIASILGQTLGDLEIVVVDDASTDGTRAVVGEAAASDPRVRPLHLPQRRGAAAARNAGLDLARGAFVGFCDDDDRWHPQKAERQVGLLRADPALTGATCWARVVDEATGRSHVLRTPPRVGFDDLLWFNFPGSFTFGIVRNTGVRLDPAFPSCQDWDFWLRCAQEGGFGTVPEVLATFTVHGGPRITSPDSEARGRTLLLDRWSSHMTPACLAYHRAHVPLRTGRGARHRARVLRGIAAQRSPRAAGIVLTEIAAAKLGARAGDPGLNARVLHRLLHGAART